MAYRALRYRRGKANSVNSSGTLTGDTVWTSPAVADGIVFAREIGRRHLSIPPALSQYGTNKFEMMINSLSLEMIGFL